MKMDEAAVVIGLDWADRSVMCCVRAVDGTRRQSVSVGASPECFGVWLEQVEQDYPCGDIVVAIERDDGALVEMMRGRPRWKVVPVNPVVLHRFRQAFTPSGAKGDTGDASLLEEVVRTHPTKFAVLRERQELLERLSVLVEQRRNWVDLRTALVEQLTAALKGYYPQALELAGDSLSSPMALAFLQRWPDLPSWRQEAWPEVEAFYRQHHCGRPTVLERRHELHATARPVSVVDSYVSAHRRNLLTIVRQIAVLNESIAEYDREIAQAFAQAPGREVIVSLPGVGPALAPRLWVACQSAGPDATASDLALQSGVAPVRLQSGEGLWKVLFRRARSRFLHQTWVEFAKHSIAGSTWAALYCAERRKKGHGANAIHRALAFTWTRIVARLWRDQTPYDEPLYLHNRAQRLAA